MLLKAFQKASGLIRPNIPALAIRQRIGNILVRPKGVDGFTQNMNVNRQSKTSTYGGVKGKRGLRVKLFIANFRSLI